MQSQFVIFSLFAWSALAVNLYVTLGRDVVSLISLKNSNGNSSLTETTSFTGCGLMPSWLTLDSTANTLYCSNGECCETLGSLSAYSVDASGALTLTAEVTTDKGGLSSALYGGLNGDGFIAVANFYGSSIATFKLPLTNSSTAQQSLPYTLSQPGTNPGRQDAAHPYQVLLDPTGRTLLVPDLGADLIRIYSVNQDSGLLTECPAVSTPPGTGPRHGVFWTPPDPSHNRMLFVSNELQNTVTGWSVSYGTAGCLSLRQTQVLTPYPNNQTATTATYVAEVTVKDNFLYMSNRNDKSFSPNDSITAYTISPTGSLSFNALTSSYGSYPRAFAINRAGDLAAIGNQMTSTVVIVERDKITGALGTKVAELKVGPTGRTDGDDGVTALIWAE